MRLDVSRKQKDMTVNITFKQKYFIVHHFQASSNYNIRVKSVKILFNSVHLRRINC